MEGCATPFLLALCGVLVFEFFRRRRENFRYFEKLGIPGPKPHILWGHYHILRRTHWESLTEWDRRYGGNYGIFWGDKPYLVTKDVSLIQKVLVKDFTNFVNRGPQLALDEAHPMMSHDILNKKGERWKSMRAILTPTFTASKMRAMVPVIEKTVADFGSVLEGFSGSFDVYPLLKRFTMENTSRTFFSIESNCLVDVNEMPRFLALALQAVQTYSTGVMDLFANSISFIGSGMRTVLHALFQRGLMHHFGEEIFTECENIIRLRLKDANKKYDFLQLLLDANEATTDVSQLAGSASEDATEGAPRKRVRNLRHEEVVSNMFVFIIAGYETSSSALGFLCHLLGKHPEVQDRLRKIIIAADKEEEQGDLYTKIMSCKYLDQVIYETLRMYPPVTAFVTRTVLESTTHQDVYLPAGLNILIPTYQVHHDPNIWPEPEVFNPERFAEKAPQGTFLPFGEGPRNCLGMRFALMTIKIFTWFLLKKYKIVSAEEIVLQSRMVFIQPDKVVVRFEPL